MTNPAHAPGRPRLDAALAGLAAVFRRSTARRDERNCVCHWGSAAELKQLKRSGIELSEDLLFRTWRAPDWKDHASVLRRILPQFAVALVNGSLRDRYDIEEAGRSIARGGWQRWPDKQTVAVQEFLAAWWIHSLTDADSAMPAHDVLVLCVEASGALGPWLDIWESQVHPMADQRLAESVAHWEYDLLNEGLPWEAWDSEDEKRAELTAWLVRYAAERLRAHDASEALLHRVRLLGLTDMDRWGDPHWPGYTT